MNVNLFMKPDRHPYDMLRDYPNAHQKEALLGWILVTCIEAGEFIPVQTKSPHPNMVAEGLLKEVGERTYELTTKSIGLLYSVYGRAAELKPIPVTPSRSESEEFLRNISTVQEMSTGMFAKWLRHMATYLEDGLRTDPSDFDEIKPLYEWLDEVECYP